MIFISDTDLYKARRVLTGRLYNENRRWAYLFCDHEDFRQWVMSAVNEGISIALDDGEHFDPTKGDLIHWCYLKARKVADRDIRQERRHRKAEQSALETGPEPEKDPFAHYLLTDQLVEILEEITQEQKQALSLVYLMGFSHEQTAYLLKRQRNAIDALIFRAKKKSREVYRRKMETEGLSPQPPDRRIDFPQPRSSLSSEPDEPDDDARNETWGEAADG